MAGIEKQFNYNLNLNGNELRNASVEKLSADPVGAGLFEGRIWKNTTEERIKYYCNGAIHVLTTYDDLEKRERLVGAIDAASITTDLVTDYAAAVTVYSPDVDGSADTSLATLDRGDKFLISSDGDLGGILGGGNQNVQAGDLVYVLVDSPSALTDFVAIDRNDLDAPVSTDGAITIATGDWANIGGNCFEANLTAPAPFTSVNSLQSELMNLTSNRSEQFIIEHVLGSTSIKVLYESISGVAPADSYELRFSGQY